MLLFVCLYVDLMHYMFKMTCDPLHISFKCLFKIFAVLKPHLMQEAWLSMSVKCFCVFFVIDQSLLLLPRVLNEGLIKTLEDWSKTSDTVTVFFFPGTLYFIDVTLFELGHNRCRILHLLDQKKTRNFLRYQTHSGADLDVEMKCQSFAVRNVGVILDHCQWSHWWPGIFHKKSRAQRYLRRFQPVQIIVHCYLKSVICLGFQMGKLVLWKCIYFGWNLFTA